MKLHMTRTKPIVLHSFAATLLAVCMLSTGCGPAKGTLKGKVTLDGAALKGGRVDFVNKSGGRSATAEINDDGTYSIPLIFAGEYSISVDTEYLKPKSSGQNSMNPNAKSGMPQGLPAAAMKSSGPPMGKSMPKDLQKEMAKHEIPEGYLPVNPAEIAKKYVRLPAKYSDSNQSGLTLKFAGGDQIHDVVMTGGGK